MSRRLSATQSVPAYDDASSSPTAADALLGCRACPRLSAFLAEVRAEQPTYHARPVLPFGAGAGRFLVVGLAPGMHGANRTGRPFTGDHAGILLYETLHAFGFASAPTSTAADDGLQLTDCRITNAVKCLPPANKPLPAEIRQCNGWLRAEIASQRPRVLLALGAIAHKAILGALGLKLAQHPFSHGAQTSLPGGETLISSYHCSRYNTQTRRLTPEGFRAVFEKVRAALDGTAAVRESASACGHD